MRTEVMRLDDTDYQEKLLILAVAVLLGLAFYHPAASHSWYPTECCDDEDCRPAKEGEVIRIPEGWRYEKTGRVYSEQEVRNSKDDRIHVCEGPYTGDLIVPYERPVCIFVPRSGEI